MTGESQVEEPRTEACPICGRRPNGRLRDFMEAGLLAEALCRANIGHYRGWDAAEAHATVDPQHDEDAAAVLAAITALRQPQEAKDTRGEPR